MIAKNLYKKLIKNGFTIAFSESITGGSVSAELVKIPNASQVFIGSIVAYQKISKTHVLGIDNQVIERYSIVSQEVAVEMAKQTSKKFNATISIGITGNAGPTFEPNTNEQKALIAIKIFDDMHVFELDLKGLTRLQSIKKTTQFVYRKCDELIP